MNKIELVSSFEEQMQRIFSVTGRHTHAELAEYFGTRPAVVSDAKRRKFIPTKWLRVLSKLLHVNPQWILTGHGERFFYAPKSGKSGLNFINSLQAPQSFDDEEHSSTVDAENIVEKEEAPEIIHYIPSKILVEELLRRIIIVEPEQLPS